MRTRGAFLWTQLVNFRGWILWDWGLLTCEMCPASCQASGLITNGWAHQVLSWFSVAKSDMTLHNLMDCSKPGFPVHHQLLELVQTHVHRVDEAIQPSHPLLSPSPPVFHLSQHQGLFKWVSSSHQVVKILELQLQHQSFQWMFRTDFL